MISTLIYAALDLLRSAALAAKPDHEVVGILGAACMASLLADLRRKLRARSLSRHQDLHLGILQRKSGLVLAQKRLAH
jgi:hypothetical protein